MTPEEKATQLFIKYLSINLSQVNDLVDGIRIRLAKDCAIIAVEEKMNPEPLNGSIIANKYFAYWKKVKQEIEAI